MALFNLKATLLLLFHVSLSLTSLLATSTYVLGSEEQEEEWRSATATYTPSPDSSTLSGGACGYGDLGRSGYGKEAAAAASGAVFARGEACGGCFEVRCVDHILWCRPGSPSVVVTAADFCAPNYGLPGDYGGWCNYPREHLDMSKPAFLKIAVRQADIVPVQYRRVNCERYGGMRFTVSGSSYFHQVLITNVAADGVVAAVKVKGSRTGWIPMARNWGQNWQCSAELRGQPLSFEVTTSDGKMATSYNAAPPNWEFGRTYEGKQFEH